MKKEKTKKRIPHLDYMCIVGERVQWENIKGEKFEGKLIEMSEDFLAAVQLDDGNIIKVQC